MSKKERLIRKYINKLKEIQGDDIEANHPVVDDLLCDLLIELGYKKVVNIYKKIEKWFA